MQDDYMIRYARRQRMYKYILVGMIAVPIILIGIFSDSEQAVKEKTPTKSNEEIRMDQREKEISKHFSAWDGSHVQLTRAIKKSMNDPDSYEHVETVYWDMKDHLVVKTTFRGTNSFGAKVLNYVKAKVDLNGNVTEVMEQGQP